MMVVISDGPLAGCSYFLEAFGGLLLGTMERHMPRALQMTPRNTASDHPMPRHDSALWLCHTLPFQTSPVPTFPLPGTAPRHKGARGEANKANR